MSNPPLRPADLSPAIKSRSSITAKSLMMLCCLCVALFLVGWLVAGQPPWRAALMTSIFVVVIFLLRLLEPAVRKFALRRKSRMLDRP